MLKLIAQSIFSVLKIKILNLIFTEKNKDC